mmetsp:Transcript_25616/g.78797  ORF Transcript_25616/g.78797 Transcript_25616/m.78797 type:complete len:362 (-) Transcript_25616:71-1156(-)
MGPRLRIEGKGGLPAGRRGPEDAGGRRRATERPRLRPVQLERGLSVAESRDGRPLWRSAHARPETGRGMLCGDRPPHVRQAPPRRGRRKRLRDLGLRAHARRGLRLRRRSDGRRLPVRGARAHRRAGRRGRARPQTNRPPRGTEKGQAPATDDHGQSPGPAAALRHRPRAQTLLSELRVRAERRPHVHRHGARGRWIVDGRRTRRRRRHGRPRPRVASLRLRRPRRSLVRRFNKNDDERRGPRPVHRLRRGDPPAHVPRRTRSSGRRAVPPLQRRAAQRRLHAAHQEPREHQTQKRRPEPGQPAARRQGGARSGDALRQAAHRLHAHHRPRRLRPRSPARRSPRPPRRIIVSVFGGRYDIE